jgi:hypothetical protein
MLRQLIGRALYLLLLIIGVILAWLCGTTILEILRAHWPEQLGAEKSQAVVMEIGSCNSSPRARTPGHAGDIFQLLDSDKGDTSYSQSIKIRMPADHGELSLMECVSWKPGDEITVVKVGKGIKGEPVWGLPKSKINLGLLLALLFGAVLGLGAIYFGSKRVLFGLPPRRGRENRLG